ncbi:hypothetical protein Lser_V15G19934 [Lactuca serriola]
MEDIDDLLVGGGAAPPGFRLPITAAVGINPIKKKEKNKLEPSSLLQNSSTHQVPGTQTEVKSVSVPRLTERSIRRRMFVSGARWGRRQETGITVRLL